MGGVDDEKAPAKPQTNASSGILEHFWNLAHLDAAVRAEAADALVKALQQSNDAAEIAYCLKRLVRGLSSGRSGARQGFSVALTQLLVTLPEKTSVAEVLQLKDETMAITGGMKAAEERDMLFGRLFCCAALVQSGRLFKNGKNVEANHITAVVNEIISSGTRKSFMKELAFGLLGQLICQLEKDTFTAVLLPVLQPFFKQADATPESVALAVLTQSVHGAELKNDRREIFEGWRKGKVLDPHNFEKLGEILRSSTEMSHPRMHFAWSIVLAVITNRPITKAYVESVFDISVLATIEPVDFDEFLFKQFWNQVVDDPLCNDTHERKFLSILLFEACLGLAGPAVPELLSPKFLTMLVKNLSLASNLLHKAASKCVKRLLEHLESSGTDDLRIGIVARLVSNNGATRFDAVTKTNTVESLIGQLSLEGISRYVETLKSSYISPQVATVGDIDEAETSQAEEKRLIAHRREWIIDQLLALVRNSRIPRGEEWLSNVATFLLAHSLSLNPNADLAVEPKKKSSSKKDVAPPPAAAVVPVLELSKREREACSARFNSVLAELSSLYLGPQKGSNAKNKQQKKNAGASEDDNDAVSAQRSHQLDGVRSDGTFWVTYLDDWAEAHGATIALDEDLKALRNQFREAVTHLKKSLPKLSTHKGPQSGTDASKHAYLLLLSFVSLQCLLDGDDARAIGEELLMCYKDSVNPPTKKAVDKKEKKEKKTPAQEENEVAEQPHDTVAVLTDILLSWLAKPSQLLRNIVDHAFRVLCPQFTLPALNLLLQVLSTSDSKAGQDDLFEEIDDGKESDAEEEDEQSDSESGSEQHNDEDEELDFASDDDEEDENGEGDDDDNEEDGEVDEELKARVKAALGSAALDEDDDADDQSDKSLDDDAMEALDEALAAAFRDRRNLKSDKKQAAVRIVHFKMRILDLIDAFIRRVGHSDTATNSHLLYELIVPLLEMLRTNMGTPDALRIRDRLLSILKNRLFRVRNTPRVPALDIEKTHALLGTVFQLAQRSADVKMCDACAGAAMLIIRTLAACTRGADKPAPAVTVETPNKKGKKGKAQPEPVADGSFGPLRVTEVLNHFRSALHDFMTRKATRLHPILFTELINRYPILGWQLASDFAQISNAAINSFRTAQALNLLQVLLRHKATYRQHKTLLVNAAPPVHSAILHAIDRVTNEPDATTSKKASAQGMKKKHIREVLTFAKQFSVVCRQENPELVPLSDYKAHLEKLAETPLVKQADGVRQMIIQIQRELGIIPPKEKNNNNKRPAASGDGSNSQPAKKAKTTEAKVNGDAVPAAAAVAAPSKGKKRSADDPMESVPTAPAATTNGAQAKKVKAKAGDAPAVVVSAPPSSKKSSKQTSASAE